jgi:hypothetical protein
VAAVAGSRRAAGLAKYSEALKLPLQHVLGFIVWIKGNITLSA